MKANIVFLEGSKKFSATEKKGITEIIESVFKDVFRIFKVSKPVIFSIYKQGKIVNGYTASPDWIRVTIPVSRYSEKELAANIYHELNHIVRGYSESENFKNNITLLDAIIAEGLGTAFEMERVLGLPYEHGQYSVVELRKTFKQLKANLNNSEYNHFEWFFGLNGKPDLFGYKMGKYIIDQVLENNSKLTLKELTIMPSSKIWRLSKIRI